MRAAAGDRRRPGTIPAPFPGRSLFRCGMKQPANLVRFVKLWLVLALAYCAVRVGFDLYRFGWVDIRRTALLDLAVVPLAQAAFVWLVYWRKQGSATPP